MLWHVLMTLWIVLLPASARFTRWAVMQNVNTLSVRQQEAVALSSFDGFVLSKGPTRSCCRRPVSSHSVPQRTIQLHGRLFWVFPSVDGQRSPLRTVVNAAEGTQP